MPKSEGQLNPFTAPYKPSVFTETLLDPKMNIPQNQELFNNVIKNAIAEVEQEEGIEQKPDKKLTLSPKKIGKLEDQEIEEEIAAIREKLRGKFKEIKEPNHMEFLQFMITNYDYKHDCWKLNHDLSLKLKDEEQREAFFKSNNNILAFHDIIA